jgi:acyl-CoA thioester hydrolase
VSDDGVEVWSGGVNTWECDEMGHMNVRFWVAKAQEGLAGLAAQLGMPRAFAADGEATMIVREQHIRFLREAHAGAALRMTGGVVELGESDARLVLIIRHPDGRPAATFQLVVEHVTTKEMRPFPWSERIRERAAGLMAQIPDFAAARSIDLSPVVATASLPRALELGLQRIGLGVIGPAECDVFGRMRPEIFIGRVSDGVARLFGDTRPGPANLAEGEPAPRIGGAVLEYRVLHLGWPEAGDGVELRSGFAGCDARTRRVIHWMVDPESGRPWASAEAVVISFDLDKRKVVDISDEAQEAYRAASPEGLAL